MYSLQACAVEQYIVMCYAAEHSHVLQYRAWAGPGWAGGDWREFGGSSERDKRNKWGTLGAMQGGTQYTDWLAVAVDLGNWACPSCSFFIMPMSHVPCPNVQCAYQPNARERRETDVNSA